MNRAVRHALVLITLLAVTGGQWAVLQSAAWAGMLVNHLRTESIASAVSKTFDGEHPCPLCKAIQRGKSSEKKSDADLRITRIEFPPMHEQVCQLKNDLRHSTAIVSDEFAESISHRPDIRPPIAV